MYLGTYPVKPIIYVSEYWKYEKFQSLKNRLAIDILQEYMEPGESKTTLAWFQILSKTIYHKLTKNLFSHMKVIFPL